MGEYLSKAIINEKIKNRLCHRLYKRTQQLWHFIARVCHAEKIQQLGYEVEVIKYIKRLSTWQKIKFVVNALRAGEWKNIQHRLTSKQMLKKYPVYAAGIAERTTAVNAYKQKTDTTFS